MESPAPQASLPRRTRSARSARACRSIASMKPSCVSESPVMDREIDDVDRIAHLEACEDLAPEWQARLRALHEGRIARASSSGNF